MEGVSGSGSFPRALSAPSGATALIDDALLETAIVISRRSPRGRVILPLHETHEDPLQRMLNALQPGSYVQPHRHARPPRAETIMLLRGSIGHILFNDVGAIEQYSVVSCASGNIGIDTRPEVFHTFFALEEDTVVFEVKAGPYDERSAKDFAPWAPVEGTTGAAQYLRRLEEIVRA